MKYTNLLGKKFSKLLVIEDPQKSRKVKVRCDCGTEKQVNKYDLCNGRIKTCRGKNCSPLIIDISGKKFGDLTALEIDKSGNGRQKYWKVECSCGNVISVPASDLLRGHTRSCGCQKGKIISDKNTKDVKARIIRSIYNSYRTSAKKRDITWELKYEDFISFLDKKCYYCLSPPSSKIRSYRKYKDQTLMYNGIDRVDNNKGYCINNCVTCCSVCNKAKNNLNLLDFVKWVKRLSENLHNINV